MLTLFRYFFYNCIEITFSCGRLNTITLTKTFIFSWYIERPHSNKVKKTGQMLKIRLIRSISPQNVM